MKKGPAHGSAFSRRFGVEEAPVLITRTLQKSSVAATYMRSDTPTNEESDRFPAEDAYMVSYSMLSFPNYVMWEDGKPIVTRPVHAGQTTFYDMRAVPTLLVNSPMDAVHFHVPRAAFDVISDEGGLARFGEFNFPRGRGVRDDTIGQLVMALLPAFSSPEQANRLFVDHLTCALAVHVANRYCELQALSPTRGGLASWQEKRAKELLEANLDGEISRAELARECGLSSSHFARAFRQSTGMPPHQWLLHRRVERAKDMLRNTDFSLATIASTCGFVDQSHFTRVFSCRVGAPPAFWRRQVRD